MARVTGRWEPSRILPTPFSFLMLKAVLSGQLCLLVDFCSARNYFFYCCPLCPHKCKNKCCALEKPWSEITQIWTCTTYDLIVFCQSTLIIQSGRNSPIGLCISQTCNGLDPAHPKLPLLMWVRSCLVGCLLVEALLYRNHNLGRMTHLRKCSLLLESCRWMSVKEWSFSAFYTHSGKSPTDFLCTNTTDDLALSSEAEKHYSAMWETHLLLFKC